MTGSVSESNPDEPTGPSGVTRRDAMKRGAMVTGAAGVAWTAPMVFGACQ